MHDPGTAVPAALRARLDALRPQHPSPSPEFVAEVVQAVLVSLSGDLTGTETALIAEVAELGRTIAAARTEIAALRMQDISLSHIPAATDELDAIVAHTAAATDTILETCETLDRVSSELEEAGRPLAVRLQEATTRIYEACSFQDITGQRIGKVVATLKTIEAKVGHIVAAFGGQQAGPVEEIAPEVPTKEVGAHGPQLPNVAMDQTDIDRLLASFE